MYCKGQLVQLQNDAAVVARAGYGIAAVSYDSQAVLAEFAKRKAIGFPLLSDHGSEVIRRYDVADKAYQKGAQLDVDKELVYTNSIGHVPVYGLSYPAVFVLARDHRVKWRVVSETAELRLTGAAILEKSLGSIVDESRSPVASRQVQVTATASNVAVGLGNRVRVSLELKIPAGFHVYGPEVGSNYLGVAWQMEGNACWDVGEAAFPKAEVKPLAPTGERLAVYEGTLRVSREMTLRPMIRAASPAVFERFRASCVDAASRVQVGGVLRFQACDDKLCYPPQALEPKWSFKFLAPDLQRSTGELRRELEQ